MTIPAIEMFVGETAEIVSLGDDFPDVKRLKNMGVREGKLIDLLQSDPLAARKVVLGVDNFRIAVHAELAAQIRVRPIKSYYEAVKVQAHYDNLTGCFNRHALEGIVRGEVLKYAEKRVPFSLLLADIDHFKKINDTYGHQEGDRVLKRFADLLRHGLRRSDVLCRWGGEEFLILLRGTLVEEASLIAERLRRMIEESIFPPFPTEGLVTVSMGGVGMPPGTDVNRLFAEADSALYTSKRAGRNRVTVCR
ncbi:diguanylate cyclase [Geobacter sulfurreducens]|uniref:GGDEF domain-containing protein n=1 Tax=Geobacter sulfurreducens TaxID=35554 RepID=UPI0001D8F44E|nr:diguanylate cyclase [Geobacter sulfurreducens]ADI86018.1 diguanylate cyclase, FeoA domain-containing [Geobacter sulfurreducens KN400]AJY69497.1 diguanylate cyclase [Geobacter sulfurreducens]QVW35052.1 diguanylate cyclase [Geobacter sulfurreducens]